ncbi:MAG: MBL fold metallo-hydrolase [Alphaproteobacteria bacterium]|nr:MBL fold metallo-hydrolase [Alphaproteobacteria bacterium]
MRLFNKTATAMCAVLAVTASSWAGEKEDTLINQVVEAYGGDALTSATSMTINDRFKVLAVGQSSNPAVMDIGINHVTLTVDFENGRKSVTNWNENRGGTFLNQVVHNGTSAHNINHLLKTTAENGNLPYAAVGGGIIRTTDVALVRLLMDARDSAVHDGEATYRGRKHEKLTFKMEGSPDLTVFVDAETGLLSKMERQNPQLGTLSYLFGKYKEEGGITYATDMNFLIAGQPNIISVSRDIDFNTKMDGAFDVPEGYASQGGNIDTSEMIARDLGNGVYYAGQNNGFSIFVDAGDHYVAAGGYPALPARLKAVQELAGNDKPLGKQIVTHHHSDHLGGMNEAAELGANFVTVADHVGPVRATLSGDVGDDRFELVNGRASYADGKVQVIDISTAHSEHYLLVYVPSANLVFSADHFSTNLESGLPPANNNMATFRTAIEALDMGALNFLGAHGSRMLTMDDLRKATDGFQVASCPAGFDICAD